SCYSPICSYRPPPPSSPLFLLLLLPPPRPPLFPYTTLFRSVTTTGRSTASASRSTFGMPSITDDITKTSNPRRSPRGFEVFVMRSEEHTSELQSRVDLVCRLLLEKKKTKIQINTS